MCDRIVITALHSGEMGLTHHHLQIAEGKYQFTLFVRLQFTCSFGFPFHPGSEPESFSDKIFFPKSFSSESLYISLSTYWGNGSIQFSAKWTIYTARLGCLMLHYFSVTAQLLWINHSSLCMVKQREHCIKH